MLARPGWAGSGVAPESWWPRAVFYRLDPARFQDSDGDGTGDLPGLVKRLDYLQSLGVDALLLDSTPAGRQSDTSARQHATDQKAEIDLSKLGELIREASRRQLRVLLTVTPAMLQGPRPVLLQIVHGWLGAGAAGISVPRTSRMLGSEGEYASLLATMREQLRSFPGERVLLSDPAPLPLNLGPQPVRLTHRIDLGTASAGRSGQLVTAALFSVRGDQVVQLRSSLAAAGQDNSPGNLGLLQFAQPPATASPNAAADAALLLGSRGAVVLDFGEELGLDLYPRPAAESELPVMQWTPSNRTSAPPADAEVRPRPGNTETQFGTYHPYQPPPRDLRAPVGTPMIKVAPDMNVPVALPGADTLPGYTGAPLPPAPAEVAQRNATSEDRDPHSLLNVYRTLIALHHGNSALRNGGQSVLSHDADGTLVWLRRAPDGTRTVSNVIGAANLSDRPVTLALGSESQAQGLRGDSLRALFSSAPEMMTGESTSALRLPPHAVFLGEVSRGGRNEGPAPRARHSRRHRARR